MMVDIIIRCKNGRDLTTKLFNSIRANTPQGSYRIILVDDGGDLPDTFDADYYVRHAKSLGAVSATNTGLGISLGLSDSDYVLILDNDTEVPAGDFTWLERMVGELERFGPRCACVGATTNYANRPQHILSGLDTYTADWKDEQSGKAGFKNQPPAIWFISFAVLFRKSVLRECGLWDERYNPGNWEDTDYAVQVRNHGYEIHVAQSVYIKHKGHATFSDRLKELLETNKQKFVEKWGPGRLWDMGLIGNRDIATVAVAAVKQEMGGA